MGRKTFQALLVLALLPSARLVSQRRGDSISVWRETIRAFTSTRPLYLEARLSLPEDLLRRGPRLDAIWLDSLLHDSTVVLCDGCYRPVSGPFSLLRLGLPRFTSHDAVTVFVVHISGWGTPPCSGVGIAGYHIRFQRTGSGWALSEKRPTDVADYMDSLCVSTRPDST